VIAQVINFLVLVWLLKRYLYKPILHAIDEREKGIAAKLAQAESKKGEADKERDEFQHKNEAFDRERKAMVQKSLEEVNVEKTRLVEAARKDADSLLAKRKESMQTERINLNRQISQWTQKEVFAIARKALKDLSTESLEERISAAFVSRLRGLNGQMKEEFAVDLKASDNSVSVRSAFDLPPAQKSDIQRAINETFSTDVKIAYETKPEVIGGIELSTKGRKVSWSISDYLVSLESSASELLNLDAKPSTKPNSSPDPKSVIEPEPKPSAPKVNH
jgi:F-type H+-transporting ATPase subunit b